MGKTFNTFSVACFTLFCFAIVTSNASLAIQSEAVQTQVSPSNEKGAGDGTDTLPIKSSLIAIDYEVPPESLPLQRVQLWYSLDDGESWTYYGDDPDTISPFYFESPTEGKIGLFMILSNEAGSSHLGPPPPGSNPQRSMFVDPHPPVVHLAALDLIRSLGMTTARIVWQAEDSYFDARPILIMYRAAPMKEWNRLTPSFVANSGRYDWVLPKEVTGTVEIMVCAQDRGGHQTCSESMSVIVEAHQKAESATKLTTPESNASERKKQQAVRWREDGEKYYKQGDYKGALVRLRESLRVVPDHTPTVEMLAEVMMAMGDLEGANHTYEWLYTLDRSSKTAIVGLARLATKKQQFAIAAQYLDTLLHQSPNEADVWLFRGDVAIFQGDEITAREAYLQARAADPNAQGIIAQADIRLDILDQQTRGQQPSAAHQAYRETLSSILHGKKPDSEEQAPVVQNN